MSHLAGVLGTNLRYSGRAVHALNHWNVSSGLQIVYSSVLMRRIGKQSSVCVCALSTLGVRTILALQNEFVNALSVLSRSSLKSDGAKSSSNELTEFTNKSLWYRAFLHG